VRWAWGLADTCPVHTVLRADRWIWGTQGDSRVRPAHQGLEGREFEEGERHATEGEPGDAWGCRCFKIPLADKMTPRKLSKLERHAARAKTAGLQRGAKVQRKLAANRAKGKTDRGDSVRTDKGTHRLELRLDKSSLRKTPQGWIVRGVAGAGDQLLDYPEYGRTEWRSLDELEAAAPSLLHAPITIEHEFAEVDPDNWQAASHGFVTGYEVVDKLLHFEALITTQRGHDAIMLDGLDKLSLAYTLDPKAAKTPITLPDGRRAGGVQRAIEFDNLTLTDSPRAGEVAALRLDKAPNMRRLKFIAIRTDRSTHRGSLPALMLAGLEAEARSTVDKRRTDAELAVGKLSVEKSDGTKVDLVLPDGMLGDVLAMIGAEPGGAAPAADADPIAEEAAAMETDAAAEEEEAAAAAIAEEEITADSKGRGDARRARPRTDSVAAMRAEVDRGLQAMRNDALRRDVEAKARPLFGSRSLVQLDAAGIMSAGVRAAGCDEGTCARASQLARQVRTDSTEAGRAHALGRLEGMLDNALGKYAADQAELERKRTDSAPMGAQAWGAEFFGAKPDDTDDGTRVDSVVDARKAMIERRRGDSKPKDRGGKAAAGRERAA
jgi:hypothetical protein